MNQDTTVISGYMISNEKGEYLDREYKWRFYTPGATPFVHSLSAVLAGGDWQADASTIFAAEYNKKSTYSNALDTGSSFESFVDAAVANFQA